MTDEEKARRAKDLAARVAFEAYGRELVRLLGEAGVPLSAISETGHVHGGVLLHEETTMLVHCRWDFTTKPEAVEAALGKVTKGSA